MLLIQSEDPSVFLDGVMLVTHCFLLKRPSRELRAVLSRVALFLAEETLHVRRVCCSFLVHALSFAFLFAFVFALLFTLAFAFVLTFAFPERVRYAPLSVRLMHRFSTQLLTASYSCSVQTNMPPPFWILWVVCQYCCFNRVLKRV